MNMRERPVIEALYALPEHAKGEIVNGRIVMAPPTGDRPARAGGAIYVSLRLYEGETPGRAYPDNTGYHVSLPERESFSPDASWYTGPSAGMRFLDGAPVFAVEIRSENDYGPAAESAIAAKRMEYFAAGTLVVWDVDLLSADVIRSFDARDPENGRIFRRGVTADAEPAVPGWRFQVNDLFS